MVPFPSLPGVTGAAVVVPTIGAEGTVVLSVGMVSVVVVEPPVVSVVLPPVVMLVEGVVGLLGVTGASVPQVQ